MNPGKGSGSAWHPGRRTRQPWGDDVWVRVFLTRVEKMTNGCWQWMGQRSGRKDTGGQYGWVQRHGRMRYAHRAYYEFTHGPLSAGFELDHLCRNRLCVNPVHLEPVTRAENMRRGDLPWARQRRGEVA